MTLEDISSIIIFTLLLIPFVFGLGLWRAILGKKHIESLIPGLLHSTGHIVGYTKRTGNTEDTYHYYPIIEHVNHNNETVWAEGTSCDKDAFDMNAKVEIVYHPRDSRDVRMATTKSFAEAMLTIDKYIGLFFILSVTFLTLGFVIYNFGFTLQIFIPTTVSYILGFTFGVITTSKNQGKEKEMAATKTRRDERLIAAQEKAEIPCYIEE